MKRWRNIRDVDMKLVAVIGAAGFVGSQIAEAIKADSRYSLLPVYRNSRYPEQLIDLVDIIIHTANPAKRLNAEKKPELDFTETVEKTAKILSMAKGKRFILISSLSCRNQLYSSYGRNRRACELMVLPGNSLIIRLGPMFGGNRKKDLIHDLLASKELHIAETTRYAYVDVKWVGKQIVSMLEEENGICEIGAYNSICLKDLRDFFDSTSVFSGIEEHQEPKDFLDGPNVHDVYNYMKHEMEAMVKR